MGKEGEREGNVGMQEIHWPVACLMLPTGDLAYNPGMCPDWESNQRPFSSQASAQSTEPHQPGQIYIFFLTFPHRAQICAVCRVDLHKNTENGLFYLMDMTDMKRPLEFFSSLSHASEEMNFKVSKTVENSSEF